MNMSPTYLSLLIGLILFSIGQAILPSSGECSLYTFVPFTQRNATFDSFLCGECNTIGMAHASAALLAVDLFNARDPSVTKELANFQDCPVQLSPKLFDTGSYSHIAAQSMILLKQEPPCAAVGAFHDIPAYDLAALSTAMKFPLTIHRAFSMAILDENRAPYTSQVFPEMIAMAAMMMWYLEYLGRTNYVAVLVSLTDRGVYLRETVSVLLDEEEITHKVFTYNVPGKSPATSRERDIENVMRLIKKSGYRTIVVSPEEPTLEIPKLAKAAINAGLTNGDYLWVWIGDYDPLIGVNDPDLREFLKGSIFVTPFEGYHLDPSMDTGDAGTGELSDPFRKAWKSQNESKVARLNKLATSQGDSAGYYVAAPDYFQSNEPEWGSAYIYDAVMATGIGACLAVQSNNNNEDIGVEKFVEGIRQVEFTGATGIVRFRCEYDGCSLPGARDPSTMIWGALNNYPPGMNVSWSLGNLMYAPQVSADYIFGRGPLYGFIPNPDQNGTENDTTFIRFLDINSLIYADGRTSPPSLLRDQPEQNYLSDGPRIAGFTLFGIVVLTALSTAIWVFRHHDHRVIKAAQPVFLYLICVGTLVSAATIVTLSFDESHGVSVETLGHLCMATPWFACVGHIITYGALFSKLWRINRVLQFSRRQVKIVHVAWPSAILFAAALFILGLWTGLDSLEWNRVELNEETGESIGECSCESENSTAYLIPLVIIVLIPTLLVFYMAWKTSDIDDVFSESKWIFMMTIIQLETLLFMGPLIPLLRDVSTDAKYVGFVLIMWIFPMSVLLLIIGPKVVAFYRGDSPERPKRGAMTGQVKVSGTNAPSKPQEASNSHTSASDRKGDEHHSGENSSD